MTSQYCTDTYDVQSVNGAAIPGGLELSCTFAEGSQAQSCILTVCTMYAIGMEEFCMNITIGNEGTQTSRRVSNLALGEYVITKVAEVERDDQVTTHRGINVIKFSITESAPATTSEPTMSIPGLLMF